MTTLEKAKERMKRGQLNLGLFVGVEMNKIVAAESNCVFHVVRQRQLKCRARGLGVNPLVVKLSLILV